MKRNGRPYLVFLLLAVISLLVVPSLLQHFPKQYSNPDFGMDILQSSIDYNQNGNDDYTDFLIGARLDAKNHPYYDPAYWEGGYPPDEVGVCTDVIWRAFREAGYSLRQMVDQDILRHPDSYSHIAVRDPNIDFRRVVNLHVFFRTYCVSLTLDIHDIEQWQSGDIVIFGKDQHIGIVSDHRNSQGQPYIIHNGGQPDREEDYLPHADVTGHYRFDAANIDADVLAPWGKSL